MGKELSTNPKAVYIREYRKSHPDAAERGRADCRARHRAMRRLADEHRQRFQELYNEERAAEGLLPLHEAKIGRPPNGQREEPF